MTSTPHPTDQVTWPIQVRLPGQTAAHPGPVDMTMMYVMHHAFRRDLAVLAAAAAVTPATDRRAWRALADRWALFAEALHLHHSGEDRGLWPRLLAVATAEESEVLAAMEAEHEGIDPMLTACASGFARLREHPTTTPAPRSLYAWPRRAPQLGEHLRHEETEAIAIIQRGLSTPTGTGSRRRASSPISLCAPCSSWCRGWPRGCPLTCARSSSPHQWPGEPGARATDRGGFRAAMLRLAYVDGPVEVR